MKLETKRLDELGIVARGKSKHRPRNDKSLYGGNFPFIQTADVKSADLYITGYKQTYNDKGLAQSKLWDSGTLCITIAANIADTAILTFPACFPDSIVGFIPHEEIADARYIKYYFDLMQKSFKQISQGATQDNLSLEKLATIQFQVPSLEFQQRIADILSTYDNLIVNNQKQIKLLEEAAMRLYKEWFVDLRFSGYETTKIVDGVPEGWSGCKLADVIDFNPKVVLPKNKEKKTIPMSALSTDSMVVDETQISFTPSNSGSKFSNDDTLLARITPCLENGKTAFVDFLEEGEIAVGSTEFIVMRSKRLNPYIVYCIARSENFRGLAINSMAGADGRQRVKLELIKDITFLLPTGEIIELCQKSMEPLFKKIKVLRKQNLLLSQSRDKLLPKLMSGEIKL